MPIYKMEGKRNGLQQYRVRVNFTGADGKAKQIDRIAYGKEEAKQLEASLLCDIKEKPLSGRMTLEELYTEYMAAKKQEVRATSFHKSKEVLERHVLPHLGKVTIDKLTPACIQKWKNQIGELPITLTMKRNIVKELNTMLNWGVRLERIPRNPIKAVGSFREVYFEKPQDALHYYTSQEYLRFAKAAQEDADWPFFVFFSIAFYTGMRKGEINALKWSDLDGNILHVRRSIAQKLKGDDVETSPKNKSSYRDLEMPEPLIDILTEHKARQMKDRHFSENYRVCGGASTLRDSSIENKNKKYSTAAKLPHIRIHDFRHTHASFLANEGISIQEIARRLGHSKVEITWNTYSHLYPREEERAVSLLNSVKL